ncbi:MAG: putative cytochrome b-561 protein [Verrucomicrobiaceae bacterium]|nr:putative cytochrome b-561 protein [Verrucomicrobiaceae bacterium]
MYPSTQYTRIAMFFHWTVAVLMLTNIGLILSVDYLPEEWARPAIDTHKSIGITVLGLFILRLLWRFAHRPPQLPPIFAKWEVVTAHFVHIGLYALMLLLPLSGWLHDSAWKNAVNHPLQLFYLIPWPRIAWVTQLDPGPKEMWHTTFGNIHTALAYIFYALFALHIAGALKHEWIDRESVLRRMWPFGSRS